jgi:hypothetical protein
MIKALEVIWIHDATIRPPGPKMVVCLEPVLGLFFRINTDPKWQTPVKLQKEPHHRFLEHDSHLECGDPLELDDYIIEQSIERRGGIIGCVHQSLAPLIYAAIKSARTVSAADKECVRRALGLPAELMDQS